MLKLSVNQISLDLTNDISITLKFTSPIFNTIGDYSYPFKLPATPKNVSVLGFKHRVESAGSIFTVFDATLEWNGILILKGMLRIIKAQADFYQANLYMDKGDFFYRRKSFTLQDIDFGEMSWTGETLKVDYFNNCRNTAYPDRNFAFPQILNESYYEELPPLTANHYFNYYNYGALSYFTDPDTRSILSPMLYLRFVLEKIFEKLEYTLEDSFFSSDPDFNSLAIYNNVDANCDLSGLFNYDKLKLFLSYHVPVMSVNDFLTGLETFFNIRFFVNNNTKTVKLVSVDKIVKANDPVEFSKNVSSIITEIGEAITGYQFKMQLNSDDPLTTQMLGQQDVLLSYMKESVDSISDLSPWPSSQNWDIRYVRDQAHYFIMLNRVWGMTPYLENSLPTFSEFVYKESSVSLETKFSTLWNTVNSPYDCLVGAAQSAWRDVSPKLFFVKFHPWNEVPPMDERVYASNFTTNNSLFYGGDNGLFAKHFKAFCDFKMNSKQVKITRQMTMLELNTLDFTRKYKINGNHYLLSELQATITNAGIKPASITAFSCL